MMTQTKYYHGLKNHKELVIICPHASDGRFFLANYPDIFEDVSAEEKEIFLRLIRIEQDCGVRELAHGIAQKLVALSRSSINVMVIEIDYPRAIIDGGRQPEHCLRGFVPEKAYARFRHEWLKIHHSTIDSIRKEVALVAKDGGFLLDLHTMAPFTPGGMLQESSAIENIKNYINMYMKASQLNQSPRVVDLMVSDRHSKLLADKWLLEDMEQIFQANNIETARNDPYFLNDSYMMTEYLKICRGIAIDIPKHLLAKESEVDFPLDGFTLENAKLEVISSCIAEAYWRQLQNKIANQRQNMVQNS